MGHLWLVGMMGSGKSTVGPLAAAILEQPFVDTDAAVVSTTGRTIPELFAEGEHVFRKAESIAITEIMRRDPHVVATGGGAVLSDLNIAAMKASGTVVHLAVDSETIMHRIGDADARPLANGRASVERLLDERSDRYLAAAEHVVSTVDRDPRAIAVEVAACAGT